MHALLLVLAWSLYEGVPGLQGTDSLALFSFTKFTTVDRYKILSRKTMWIEHNKEAARIIRDKKNLMHYCQQGHCLILWIFEHHGQLLCLASSLSYRPPLFCLWWQLEQVAKATDVDHRWKNRQPVGEHDSPPPHNGRPQNSMCLDVLTCMPSATLVWHQPRGGVVSLWYESDEDTRLLFLRLRQQRIPLLRSCTIAT
jgi:hypothetical protein